MSKQPSEFPTASHESAPKVDTRKTSLKEVLHSATCPACGHHVGVTFFDGGKHPLSILAWPSSPAEARNIERLPLMFIRCVDCGHVYNRDFDYAKVPYSEKPNLMFNNGQLWADHLKNIKEQILERLPANPTVLEIGCGDGHLLRALAKARPEGRFIGFDPSGTLTSEGPNIEAFPTLFDPTEHLAEFKPDLIISRHVMEHLKNPLEFIQSISFAATWTGIETALFIEVPCIDRVFSTGRTTDFFYEHNSHFTSNSLKRFLSRCANSVETVERGYGDEVVYGFAQLGIRVDHLAYARDALQFNNVAQQAQNAMNESLSELFQSGKKVAIWGGTGKSSTFINRFGLDAYRFPLVVDSDPEKSGTFVPGSGQEIILSDTLIENPVDVILVTSQWRARDILLEIEQKNIPFETILIEHKGKLINFFTDTHPYSKEERYHSKPPSSKLLPAKESKKKRMSNQFRGMKK